MAQPHCFIFGLGYTGQRLAHALLTDGWRVSGTCREDAKATTLRASDIEAICFSREQPMPDAHFLEGVTHIVHSIPPDAQGDAVYDLCRDAIRQAVSHGASLKWFSYLSTTGVYGDTQGEWVDETSPLRATGERQLRRVAAEGAWLEEREYQVPMHVFRLAGIYGPGRSAFDSLRAGKAKRIDKPGQYFSRIHVDDIVTILQASMAQPVLPSSDELAIYNLCDDKPAPAAEVVAYAAELAGYPVPPLIPFEEAELSPMARSFYSASRRVSNQRMKDRLGVELRYPGYRVGLQAICQNEKA